MQAKQNHQLLVKITNHTTLLFFKENAYLAVSEHKNLGIYLSNDGQLSTTIKLIVE